MKKINLVILSMLLTSCTNIGLTKQPVLEEFDYLRDHPTEIPEKFMPGFVSLDDRYELMSTFSPDGSSFLFTVSGRRWDKFNIFSTNFKNGAWTVPIEITLFDTTNVFGPVFFPDGSKLFFSTPDWYTVPTNIWYSTRNGKDWAVSNKFVEPINSDYNEWGFSFARDQTIVFSSNRPGGKGDYDLYISKLDDSNNYEVNNLINLNSNEDEYSVYIAPDKSYIIYSSQMEGGYGWDDLYISYWLKDSTWSDPINLGPIINTEHAEYAPHVSPDGKYLFFSKWGAKSDFADIYWARANFIEELKPQI